MGTLEDLMNKPRPEVHNPHHKREMRFAVELKGQVDELDKVHTKLARIAELMKTLDGTEDGEMAIAARAAAQTEYEMLIAGTSIEDLQAQGREIERQMKRTQLLQQELADKNKSVGGAV